MKPASLAVYSFLLASSIATTAACQNPSSTVAIQSNASPSDPLAIVMAASRVNGLHSNNLQPWHVHATFQILDDKGHTKDQGTFEEWWAAEKKYKIQYSATNYHAIYYGTEAGVVRTGDEKLPDGPILILETMLNSPLPDDTALAEMRTFERVKEKAGSLELECAVFRASGGPVPDHPAPQFCFGNNVTAIRVIDTATTQTMFNSIIQFQGRYIARQIVMFRARKLEMNINFDTVETLANAQDATFAPPPEAAPLQQPVVLASEQTGPYRIAGQIPFYPEFAKAERVQGTVTFSALIREDGTVGDLQLIGGPQEMRDVSLKTVRSWRYHPFILGGEPVSVRTEIKIVFQLGS